MVSSYVERVKAVSVAKRVIARAIVAIPAKRGYRALLAIRARVAIRVKCATFRVIVAIRVKRAIRLAIPAIPLR